jgi:hypothetical protein
MTELSEAKALSQRAAYSDVRFFLLFSFLSPATNSILIDVWVPTHYEWHQPHRTGSQSPPNSSVQPSPADPRSREPESHLPNPAETTRDCTTPAA